MIKKRYSGFQLRLMASKHEGSNVADVIAAMLRQAADDCEDAERYKAALERIASARTTGLPEIHTSSTPRIARAALAARTQENSK